MSANRRFRRQQERFKTKIHKEFMERIKGMSEDQIKSYVNKMVEKYSYLNDVSVIQDGSGPLIEDMFDKNEEESQNYAD